MSDIVYVNGEYVPANEAKISVFDHGLLYGDGVFEGIRYYKRNVFRLKEHVDRLFDSAKFIMLDIKQSREEIAEIVLETCRRNPHEDGYVRLIITRGAGTLGLNPYLCSTPGVICIVAKIQLYPVEYYENGLPIITASTRRVAADALSPRVKSLNYLNNIMAKIEAIQAGVLEALMLDGQGYIVECTGDNVFIIRDGIIYTPPVYQGALRGVTRDAVMEIARNQGLTVKEERLTLYEAYTADECFLTGTAAEVVPVTKIDSRTIGDGTVGTITKQLLVDFKKLVTVDGRKF